MKKSGIKKEPKKSSKYISKSAIKNNVLSTKYNLPDYVYDGSCERPIDDNPHYYKLAEDNEGKITKEIKKGLLIDAIGVDTKQLAASYWKLLLGPTQFIYWDPIARNNRNIKCKLIEKPLGKWILISKARDILEGESPPTQCNNVIGNNSYLNLIEYKNWYNSIFGRNIKTDKVEFHNLFNFFTQKPNGFIEFRNKCCWICGFPLYPEGLSINKQQPSTKPPCEHILPVVNAIFNLKLYEKDDNIFTQTHKKILTKYNSDNPLNSFNEQQIQEVFDTGFISEYEAKNYIENIPQLNQLLKEYAWSHTCCNSIKNDYNLIKTYKNKDKYEIIPNRQKIEQLLKQIGDTCLIDNINLLNIYNKNLDNTSIQISKIKKNINSWVKSRTENIMIDFLKPICNYTNQTYSDVPILYNLASIASIIHTVPDTLRNLLLFNTVLENKIQTPAPIEVDQNIVTYDQLSLLINELENELAEYDKFKEIENIHYPSQFDQLINASKTIEEEEKAIQFIKTTHKMRSNNRQQVFNNTRRITSPFLSPIRSQATNTRRITSPFLSPIRSQATNTRHGGKKTRKNKKIKY